MQRQECRELQLRVFALQAEINSLKHAVECLNCENASLRQKYKNLVTLS